MFSWKDNHVEPGGPYYMKPVPRFDTGWILDAAAASPDHCLETIHQYFHSLLSPRGHMLVFEHLYPS